MTADLSGSVALVTGGNSGIGRATAARLALNGAHVIVTGRDTTRGDQAVERIRSAGGKADFVAASLSGEASARKLARKAVELGGGHIDILVNNAGIFPFGATASHTEADFDGVYGVNVKVPFFLVAELAPAMAARGKGSIINVTTMVAQFGGVAGLVACRESTVVVDVGVEHAQRDEPPVHGVAALRGDLPDPFARQPGERAQRIEVEVDVRVVHGVRSRAYRDDAAACSRR